ncbi:aldose reductase-related protein 1-like [Pomacea canaliculata]|uniref:aldose reductase-related protein 1-like n=1 Tax=Pomacea canaliculata TaxID=400727 RepID=UPI000D72774D|nr:aldose reductase-related protein 1-like [Pomacea canaliculata]
MAACPTVTLSSGYKMPVLGFGTYNNFMNHEAVGESVKAAVDAGYRHIDTAYLYLTEPAVGRALRQKIDDGVVKRDDLFICSKLWSDRHADVEESVMESLNDLGLSYLDLYIIHHPVSLKRRERIQNLEDVAASVRTRTRRPSGHLDMEKLVDKGLVRSIGLSNFTIPQITRILKDPGLRHKPVYLQVEVHPYFRNSELVDFCKQEGIVVTAYAPIGRAGTDYGLASTENVLHDPVLNKIGAKYRKTTCTGGAALAYTERSDGGGQKSDTCSHSEIIFDFELTCEDMEAISALDRGFRLGTFAMWKNFT